ncbi:MAG TPA: ROK family protein [Candidatus Paceibacterota bacterium]|jgi:cell division ATPase FtsA|nr:ROK family protein [Candidatus Paceibacterota bacterium]
MSIFSQFSLAKKKDELVLVFDIGSSSVKAALFYMQKSGIPKIITSVREPILLEDKIEISRFLSLTLKALEIAAGKIHAKALGAPARIFCVFSSPWQVSHTRIIHLEKNTPFVFSSKLADTLIQKEISLLKEEYLKQYPHIDNSLRLIELKNIQIRLNGYETSEPLNKKTKEVEMTVFISMSEEQVCKKIEETINKYFHGKTIKFSPFTFTCFTVVRDLFPERENFLLVNIGGEITDISMIKQSALRESISFPLGINFMIRSVAARMASSLSEAKSLISLVKDGHAGQSTAKSLEPEIEKLKSEWLAKFQESLANLSSDISIPAFIYITVDKDLADFFAEVIKTEQFNQYTLTESKFQIFFLNVQNLHDTAVFDKDAMWNAFLAIDSGYINRFLNKI